jgi:hypothetical protein
LQANGGRVEVPSERPFAHFVRVPYHVARQFDHRAGDIPAEKLTMFFEPVV